MPGRATESGIPITDCVDRVGLTKPIPVSPAVVTPRPAGDDLSPNQLPRSVVAAVGPAVTALRWGAVGYAAVVIAAKATGNTWTDVAVLAVCVFLTTLRTLLPLELGDPRPWARGVALVDAAVFGLAAGWSGGTDSPWVFCTLAAVAVASFGWGTPVALASGATAVTGVLVDTLASGTDVGELVDSRRDLTVALTMAVAAAAGVYLRGRLVDADTRARRATGELAALADANRLLSELSEVALTLPGSFTLREALQRIRGQLDTFLHPRVIALVTLDEHSEEWTPKITDRCAMRAAYRREELPGPLREVLDRGGAVSRSDLVMGSDRLADDTRSGLYLPLVARDRVIGIIGLEHPDPGHFDSIEPTLRDGLADVIALTVDNARWFGRLRSLGAEEERIRVARDIHDRLGQWMTYIKLELERLSNSRTVEHSDLERLHDDAAAALDELRETLRQLRSGVSDDRPLAVMGRDLVTRFADRTDVAAHFLVAHPDQRLPVPVENELLRILQEALNNIDRHAKADHVEVAWTVDGGNYELVVADDGRGFDPERAIREQAFGVVGMRERAEVIGAVLRIDSHPGGGTKVIVSAGRVHHSAGAEGHGGG